VGRQLDERLGDEHRDRVEVASVRDQAEALRFEGDRPSTTEGVEHFWRVVAAGTADLFTCFIEHRLILGGFPGDEPFDQAEEPLTLLLLGVLSREAIGVGGGVVDELGEEHGTTGGEWAARPPQVERRGVSVADRLLSGSFAVDRLEGKCDLDELAAGGVVV
jgi:hypothetical protein